ncbi:MAG TPA: hypothetical protein VKT80_19685 [Chloroflexota bacterium]|nr:hypothetical protein [Chloroflexota bacterium]
MMKLIERLARDDSGTETVEFALTLSLVVMVAVAAMAAFGSNMGSYWNSVSNKFSSAF